MRDPGRGRSRSRWVVVTKLTRLFALHHVLERRARAKRRIVGRRNLQRRTRGRVTSLASGARLSGKRAKLGDGHLVARANRRADLVKRRRQHASDVRLRLTRLRRHGIDESLLVQSRRRVSSAIESRAHSSVVPPVRALASRFQFKNAPSTHRRVRSLVSSFPTATSPRHRARHIFRPHHTAHRASPRARARSSRSSSFPRI